MKVKWIFTLIQLLSTHQLYSQNFGTQFKDWVLSEAATDSRALAKADYEARTAHTVNKIDKYLIRNIQLADSLLNEVYSQIEKDEKAMPGLDTLQTSLQRARSARIAYYNLLKAENHLHFALQLKTNLDSLGSKKYFYGTGLYHVGRETLLESYASVGARFADNFQLKYHNDYKVSAGVTFDESSNTLGASGSVSQQGGPGMYAIIGTAVGAYGGYIGAAVGGLVGSTVDYFVGRKKAKEEQKKQKKRFERQMQLLHEGLKILPEHLAPIDTLLSYYQNFVKQANARNAPVYQQIDSTLNLQNLRFKEIFSYNIKRQQLSQQQLTIDRIALIERNFQNLEGLRNFYSNLGKVNFINDYNSMMSQLTVDENWLRTVVINRFDWLQRSEAYQDDLKFALTLTHRFLGDETYIPCQSYLTQRKVELETMANNLPQLPKALFTQQKMGTLFAMSASSIAATNRTGEKLHLVFPKSVVSLQASFESFDVDICYSSGVYSLCSGNGTSSYGGRFNNNGQSPITDILGSASDGGLRSFGAIATRQIDAMKDNIQKRVSDLRQDFTSLTQVIPSVQVNYRRQANEVAESAEKLGERSGEEILRFSQQFDIRMPDVQRRLNQYMNQPVRTGLSDLLRDLNLTREVNAEIKQTEIPVSVFRISGVDFGYQSAAGRTAVALAWEREAGKQVNALKEIERSVTANRNTVFKNRSEFETFKTKLGQIDQLFKQLEIADNFNFEDKKQVASHYLAQVIKMRYAASGLLLTSELIPLDYPFLEREQSDLLKGLVNDFKKCNSENDDCAGAYGNAIYQIYRNNSVVGLTNAEGQSFNAINLHQLATSSSDWQVIGPASSDAAVSQAALLAMSGNPVIATWPDGMDVKTGIVLPMLPKPGMDGKWTGMQVPQMFYLDENKPERSFAQGPMSASFPYPNEVTFYANEGPQNFDNIGLRIKDKGIRPFAYSDPVAGDRATVPSLNFSVQAKVGGALQESEQTVPIAGDYVDRVVKQYGNNSRQVFENIYAHRDELFGNYPADPLGLTTSEIGKLRNLRQKTGAFEGREGLLAKPDDFYYCQTSRCLYNSCINELRKADPLDRGKILDYYNEVEDAWVKYRYDAIDIGTGLTPGINDARDLYELVTGLDMVSGANLTYWERGLSATGLLVGSGAFYRQIDNLPQVRQSALEIARMGIPDFKMIKSGDLKYYFQSKGGIYYERWNGKIGSDRLTKIIKKHYIERRHSYFTMDSPTGIPALLDEAWKLAKDRHLIPFHGDNNNVRYIVDMGRPVGKNEAQFVNLVFDGTKGPGFIITAFPSHGKYPELP